MYVRFYFSQGEELRDMDVILQLFSPLVTSQRFMINHFSNAYASIQCYDGLSIVFDEVSFLEYEDTNADSSNF